MLTSHSGILAKAIGIASTSLQQRQPVSLTLFLQCLHLHQLRFPILIHVQNRQLKHEYVQLLSMVECVAAKDFIVTYFFLRIITFFINGTHRENLFYFQWLTRMVDWLLLTVFICLHNQLSSIHSIISYSEYRCLKNVIHQIDSKNEWLLLRASFTAKFGLAFVLILENNFFRSFILKPTERVQVFLKNGNRDFRNIPPFERLACFYVTICENFERFQYFNFETDFLENENLFQKTGVPFFS